MRLMACLLLAICFVSAIAQPDSGTVQRPDVLLHYRSIGKGEPLLILSGGPGQDVKQLQGVVEGIKDIRRCILLDQRGTGQSKLASISRETIKLDLYVEDIESLRRELKLEKLALLGHSWGAMLAASYSAKYPQRVSNLILIDSGPLSWAQMSVADDNVAQRRKMLQVGGKLDEGQDLFELRPFFYDQQKAVDFAKRDRTGEVAANVSGPLFQDLRETNFDSRPGLKKLSAPMLILQGRQDIMPETVLVEWQSLVKGAQLKFVERAGHFPWIENPKGFFAALREYLQGTG